MAAPTEQDDVPKSAVPLADLSVLDKALKGDDEALARCVRSLRPADVGRDLSRRTADAGRRIVLAADDRRGSTMLRAAHPGVAAKIVSQLPPEAAGRLLAHMPTEPRTAILTALEEPDRVRLEGGLMPDERSFFESVLRQKETAVAHVMTPRFWAGDHRDTIGAALDRLKAEGENIEVAANLYVTASNKLIGVVPLREAAVHDRAATLESVMTPDPISLPPDADRGDAAEILQTHNFLSLPIADSDNRLVGVVRVDDVLDAALERSATGMLNQGGVAGKVAAKEPYFLTPISKVVRSRITWLVLLFVAETLTGTVLRHFEDELQRVVALSFFVPLLIGTGGNAGSQTVSTVIRALALGEVRVTDVWRVLGKEVTTGVILGVLLAAVAYVRALMWGVGSDLALCVSITILVVCTWANLVGAIIPITAEKLKIDPTVVSGPMITTLVDASGLFIYLTIAHWTVAALAH